jgi:hypothetical protein
VQLQSAGHLTKSTFPSHGIFIHAIGRFLTLKQEVSKPNSEVQALRIKHSGIKKKVKLSLAMP